MKERLVLLAVIFLLAIMAIQQSKAQSGAIQYYQPASGTTVTNCGTPAAGSTPPLCGVATGWFVWSGTAWVQLGVTTAAGVTSWNGQTGAVTYTAPAAPVTSVNGKTGAVTLAIQ